LLVLNGCTTLILSLQNVETTLWAICEIGSDFETISFALEDFLKILKIKIYEDGELSSELNHQFN
jgi:hypothetical protein